MENSTKTIIENISDFLVYCDIERGFKPMSTEGYGRLLKKFKEWLESQGLTSLLPDQLTPDHIWNYRLYISRHISPLTERTLTRATQHKVLVALRSLLAYFQMKDIPSLWPGKVVLPKLDMSTHAVKFLTLEQISKLLSSVEPTNAVTIRDRAILEIFFSTGMRISELTSLNLDQFEDISDKDTLEISVIGKGGKTRTVYISQRSLTYLKKYLEIRRAMKVQYAKALFTNYKEKYLQKDIRLSSRYIQQMVKKYVRLAGLPEFTTPHTLRHSYATDLMNQGVDLRSIQEFLGHSSIATTQIYTHVTNKRLRELHHQFHGNRDF